MYGLPQAGKLAHDDLVKHLAIGEYFPAKHTPGLFQNKSRSIQFTLIVDDFGVKYTNTAALHHLIKHLKKKYAITDEPGTIYSGIHLSYLNTHLIPTPSPNMDLEYNIRQSNRI